MTNNIELNEIAVASPSSASMSGQTQDTPEGHPRSGQAQEPPKGHSICPLCSHEVRLYFVNFNEKIEMCGNYECDYPFGYLPLKLLRESCGAQNVGDESVKCKSSNSSAKALPSTAAWYDVNKSNTLNNGLSGLDFDNIKRSKLLEKSEADKKKAAIKRDVEQIREMTKSMNEMDNEKKSIIKNKSFLKKLSYLQGLSGVSLMKPEEMQKLNKKLNLGMGELKIDIDNISSTNITIAINHHPSTE